VSNHFMLRLNLSWEIRPYFLDKRLGASLLATLYAKQTGSGYVEEIKNVPCEIWDE